LPFLFAAADSPGGGVGFRCVDFELTVVVF